MNFRIRVILCCLLIGGQQDALGEKEDKSEEMEEQEMKLGNDTSSPLEIGPLDSHEAMNNRELNPKIREKRSYEFLMGLINNNSKYEVTKVDPSGGRAPLQPNPASKVSEKDIKASELLLELIVRIAAHPDQWDKVHQLLKNIDHDLDLSRAILEKMKTSPDQNVNKKSSKTEPGPKIWPKFDLQEEGKKTYQKNFAYHRVTGKPIHLNKNPKAYIAVSVIAPKPINGLGGDDPTLENELHQLRPWTHNQNLKDMASIRSRWIIQSDDKKSSTGPGI